MSSVTCVVHGGEIDRTDAVDLPQGPVCLDCYNWMESLIESDQDDDEDEFYVVIFTEDDD